MKRAWVLLAEMIFASILYYTIGCRTGEEWVMNDGNRLATIDGGETDAPDTQRDAGSFDDQDAAPDTLPTGHDPSEYATDVIMVAGCEQNPAEAAVAKAHKTDGMCEHLTPIAALSDNYGDFYQVYAPFVWQSLDQSVIDLSFPLGPANDFAVAHGMLDLFDTDGVHEPKTTVWACAANVCPVPRPSNCADLVCASVVIFSVVNLEGTWTMSGATFAPNTQVSPSQDGRVFDDDKGGVYGGVVNGASVSFATDDYSYLGTISADRVTMNGTVYDLLGDAYVGDWSATRSQP